MLESIVAQALPFEVAFSHLVQAFANPSLDYFFRIITYLGNPVLWVALMAFIFWSGEEKRAFFLALSLLLSSAFVGVAKPLIGRPRPSAGAFRVVEMEGGFSFPSGHATVIATVFGYYYEKFRKHSRAAGLVIVLLVMLSRIYLGVHYLLDVVFGALIGFVIGRVVHYFEQNYKKISIREKMVLEEIGMIATVVLAIGISVMFTPLSGISGLMGFFAGIFAFKLLGMDSTKVSGLLLWAKEIVGFAVLGGISLSGTGTAVEPVAYFAGGAWITFVYPIIFEKVLPALGGQPQAQGMAASAGKRSAKTGRARPVMLIKKSKH